MKRCLITKTKKSSLSFRLGFILFFGIIFSGVAFNSASSSAASFGLNQCGFFVLGIQSARGTGSSTDYWNSPNYDYSTFEFLLQTSQNNQPSSQVEKNNSPYGIRPYPEYITSSQCTGGGDPTAGDLVNTLTPANGNYTTSNSVMLTVNGVNEAPDAAMLGIPLSQNVNWNNNTNCGGATATVTEPTRQNSPTACTQEAAYVDDAGRATILNQQGLSTTIWNANISNNYSQSGNPLTDYINGPATQPPQGAQDCNISTTPNNKTLGGDLYEYYPTSGVVGYKLPGGNTGNNPNGAGAFGLSNTDWLCPSALSAKNPSTGYIEFTNMIGANCTYKTEGTDPILCPFHLELEAKSSYAPNIAALMVMTFRYMIPTPSVPQLSLYAETCSNGVQQMGVYLSGWGNSLPTTVNWTLAPNVYASINITPTGTGTGTGTISLSGINQAQSYSIDAWVPNPQNNSNPYNPYVPPGVVGPVASQPCGSTGGGPAQTCGAQESATAWTTQNDSASYTTYYPVTTTTTNSSGQSTSTTTWEPKVETASGTAHFTTMTINYQFTNGTNGTVYSGSNNPDYFNSGTYTGFQAVSFTGTAYYAGTVTVTVTNPGGSTSSETIPLITTPTPVVFNPPAYDPTTLTVQPCVVSVTCGPASLPGIEGLGRNFNGTSLGEQYVVGSSGSPPYNGSGDSYTASYSGGTLTVTDGTGAQMSANEISYSSSPGQGPGTITWAPHMFGTPVGSNYNLLYGLNGPSTNPIAWPTCSAQQLAGNYLQIASQPYLTVNGGDSTAGGGFQPSSSGTCSFTTSNIQSWNSNDGSLDAANPAPNGDAASGAGDEFAAWATGNINGFATSQVNQPNTLPPLLSFANTVNNSPPGAFGGQLGNLPCLADYAGMADSQFIQANPSTPLTQLLNGGGPSPSNGQYLYTGTQTISSNISLPSGSPTDGRYVIYIDGDLVLAPGAAISANTAAAQDPTTAPNVIFIVMGNIYISPAVTNLYGEYIAQPTAANPTNTGNIYTCSTGDGDTTFPGGGSCSSQLVVNGSLDGSHVYLWRTFGTLGQRGGVTHAPAEMVQYNPLTWLSEPPNPTYGGYDAITSLPPVL